MALLAAACDSPVQPTPQPPPPPPGSALEISCPASETVDSPNGNPVVVEYPNPSVVGGIEPIALSCAPASGSPFAVGSTTVNCSAHDKEEHVAQCDFTATVVAPPPPVVIPKLKVGKFVAFGDSITYGTIDPCPNLRTYSLGGLSQDVLSFWLNANASTAYPFALQNMLTSRYQEQSISVVNEGFPGEMVTRSSTRDRLRSVLSQYAPDVLLLQEGINDVHSPATVDQIADGLDVLVRDAKGRGVSVLLGTLLPENEGACRAYAPERIPPVNARIRDVAARESVGLVDLYQAFLGQEDTLLSEDGLHPSVVGYEKMADVFFTSIRANFETAVQGTTLTRQASQPRLLRARRP